MSTQKYSIFDTVMARVSQGAVPFDSVYWVDPDAKKTVPVPRADERDVAARIRVGRKPAALEFLT